jgi:hypothetical protein
VCAPRYCGKVPSSSVELKRGPVRLYLGWAGLSSSMPVRKGVPDVLLPSPLSDRGCTAQLLVQLRAVRHAVPSAIDCPYTTAQ